MLENYQQADGSVVLPPALQCRYLGETAVAQAALSARPCADQLRLPIIRRSTYQNISAIEANSCIAADT